MEKTLLLSLKRVNRAYQAVTSGRAVADLPSITRIWQEAHLTEFFTREDAMIVERIECEIGELNGTRFDLAA